MYGGADLCFSSSFRKLFLEMFFIRPLPDLEAEDERVQVKEQGGRCGERRSIIDGGFGATT